MFSGAKAKGRCDKPPGRNCCWLKTQHQVGRSVEAARLCRCWNAIDHMKLARMRMDMISQIVSPLEPNSSYTYILACIRMVVIYDMAVIYDCLTGGSGGAGCRANHRCRGSELYATTECVSHARLGPAQSLGPSIHNTILCSNNFCHASFLSAAAASAQASQTSGLAWQRVWGI